MSDLAKKIGISIITTLLLALIYFIGENLFFKTPDLSGPWQFETKVKKTDYKLYQGMKLTFIAFLNQNGLEISGSGEKIKENLKGKEKEYIGAERIRIEITGRIEKNFLKNHVVHVQFKEYGKLRISTTRQTLIYKNSSMDGTYISTVSDQSGDVNWIRKQH